MVFFSTTALGPGSPAFRGRAAELTRLQRLCRDDVTRYGVIYGGRQNGKTSLLFQLLGAVEEPTKLCRIDFQQIQGALPEQVFAYLAEQINPAVTLTDVAAITSAPRLRARLNEALARPEVGRLVLLLDEIGALPPASREALGNALRSFFHDRLVAPPLQKLLVIFSGGVELYSMVVSEVSSLHNVCEEIYLPDLPAPEAVALIADGLQAAGVAAALSSEIGRAVYSQVAGHPYLTQRMGELLVGYHDAGAALGLADVERAATEIVSDAPPLLRRIRDDLRQHQLEDAARRLLRDQPRFSRLDDAMVRLELVGLAKRDGARWAPRNMLLATVFRELLDVPAPEPGPITNAAAALTSAPTAQVARPASEVARIEEAQRTTIKATAIVKPASTPSWVPDLIHIPAGPFLMGSNASDNQASKDEMPQHMLALPDYWIGKMPVTNAQFRLFVENDGYHNPIYWTKAGWQWCKSSNISESEYLSDPKWNSDIQPIVGVSWFEAVAYCRWLSTNTGYKFRLPSEAEWEKSNRGPDGRIWPWGNIWEPGRCNNQETGMERTTPVNQYTNGVSSYGAFDMAGNIWEWCTTKWRKNYPYQVEDEWQSTYLEDDSFRVFRGGSWGAHQKSLRAADRDTNFPQYRGNNVGLRVVSSSAFPGSE